MFFSVCEWPLKTGLTECDKYQTFICCLNSFTDVLALDVYQGVIGKSLSIFQK